MSFKFACYYPAEDKPLFLPISIEADSWVEELSMALQGGLKLRGREVSYDDFRLFKVNLLLL